MYVVFNILREKGEGKGKGKGKKEEERRCNTIPSKGYPEEPVLTDSPPLSLEKNNSGICCNDQSYYMLSYKNKNN